MRTFKGHVLFSLICISWLVVSATSHASRTASRPVAKQNQDGALYQAAEEGRLTRVKILLQQGAEVNGGVPMKGRLRPNAHEETPLAAAVKNNHTEVALLLLHRGASVNTGHYEDYPRYVSDCRTPLMNAATNGNLPIVRLLLERGAKVDDLSNFGSALSYAAEAGHIQIVKTLVAWGADVNVEDHYGTSVERAAEAGNAEIVRYLIRHGARVNVAVKWDKTPLLAAAEGGHVQATHVLLSHGARINYCSFKYGTALMVAAEAGHLEVVRCLLQRGARVNIRALVDYGDGERQSTALSLAHRNGHTAIANLLKRYGATEQPH